MTSTLGKEKQTPQSWEWEENVKMLSSSPSIQKKKEENLNAREHDLLS